MHLTCLEPAKKICIEFIERRIPVVEKNSSLYKVKGPTLLLTLYLLTH